jgi:ABC-type bacteriocin/lantibiotic exporter with double-glycine peptidase domain
MSLDSLVRSEDGKVQQTENEVNKLLKHYHAQQIKLSKEQKKYKDVDKYFFIFLYLCTAAMTITFLTYLVLFRTLTEMASGIFIADIADINFVCEARFLFVPEKADKVKHIG